MRLTSSFVAYEIRTQARSLRFRAFAGLYVLAGTMPAILTHFLRGRSPFAIGEATYVDETLVVLPVLTAVLAFLLSLDGVTREQGDGAWTTVTLCGVSNAGYLLRRWVALLAVILPLIALPLLAAAGIAAADGIRPLEPGAWLGPWLFLLVPLALCVSALGLGVGTIGGGSLSSLPLLALLLAVVPAFANEALHHVRLVLDSPMAWLNLRGLVYSVGRATKTLQGRRDWGFDFPQPGSEAGADLGVLGIQSFVTVAPLSAIAVATLGAAVLYLRRTRPDLKPRPVRPDHPLRSTLLLLAKMRERYKPDPAPARADRLAVAGGLIAAMAILGLLFGRAYAYESQADVRYAAEESAPAPTPPTVLPGRWRIEGGLGPGSRVDLRVSGEMINAGRTPADHLAFQLNRDLALEVAADAGTVSASRAWDRMTLTLAPPIPPGGRRELRFRLSGVPTRTVFPQSPAGAVGGKPSFKGSYEIHRGAQFSRDRLNFAAAWREPSISGFGVDLSRGALLPIPVYGGWHREDEPAAEAVSPSAEVEVALAVPAGAFLADSCGGVAAGGRLASRCRATLADFAVVGGRHALLKEADNQGMAVAVFPAHRQVADLHLGFLSQSAGMIEEAWPGIGSLGRLVVVEWKDRTRNTPYWAYFDLEDSFVKVKGNLVFLEEVNLIGVRALDPERLVSEILAVRLASRRRLDPKQSLFFRQFLKDVALERLGLGPVNGAAVGPLHPADEAAIQVSPFAENAYFGYWSTGFPALMSALRSRMGDEPLRAAVEEFLDRGDDPSAPPGTAEELFDLLQRRSPNPIDRLIRDSFQGPALPYPVLDGVEFRRAGDGWRVTGRMKNEGMGEAFCKVVLATDLGPESTMVRADAGQSSGFELATRYRPQSVVLDPGHECHRLVKMGGPRDRAYFTGGAR
ncbi:MAG: hypothetical protein ABUT39_17035 [Acidobacteriota bacterium]